jgi:hypothetical protein
LRVSPTPWERVLFGARLLLGWLVADLPAAKPFPSVFLWRRCLAAGIGIQLRGLPDLRVPVPLLARYLAWVGAARSARHVLGSLAFVHRLYLL